MPLLFIIFVLPWMQVAAEGCAGIILGYQSIEEPPLEKQIAGAHFQRFVNSCGQRICILNQHASLF